MAEYVDFDLDDLRETTPRPRVGIDDHGNAIAIWERFNGKLDDVWASRLEDGAWGAATRIEPANRVDAFMAEMAMDATGDAVVVWLQHDRRKGRRTSVWTTRYSHADQTWSQARPLETDDKAAARQADVAIDGYGNAVAVWRSGRDIRAAVESLDAAPPIADAGPDRESYKHDLVLLDGSGSFDPAGQALKYHWHQVSGKEVDLRRKRSAHPRFVMPRVREPRTLVFILTVTSASGVTATDTVTVVALP